MSIAGVEQAGVHAVVEQLKSIIAEELDVNLLASEIDGDASFFEGGLGIDSIAVVELIALAEDRFGIRFADEDLVAESFSSLSVLAGMIAAKMNGEAAEAGRA